MKGKGTREERETIINFNEKDGTASIWTASEAVYRQLLKRGYFPVEDGERHAVFEMPKRDVKLPRPKRQASEAQRQAVMRMRMAVLSQEPSENTGPEQVERAETHKRPPEH